MSTVSSLQTLKQARGHSVEVALDEIEIVVPPPEAAEPDLDSGRPVGVLMLVEMILKAPRRLDRRIREIALQPRLIPLFLTISLASFTLFGVALSLVLASAHVSPRLTALDEFLYQPRQSSVKDPDLIRFIRLDAFSDYWTSGAAWRLIVAYSFGLIAATGVCLPSLYFYGLLSGIRLSMLDVTTHAMKAKATSAVALLGILPIYIAIALGVAIFDWLPASSRDWMIGFGLVLPFLAGLFGTASLYRGFENLTDTLPPERCARRGCFLRRLVVSWSACYTAVAPVMIFTVWEALQ